MSERGVLVVGNVSERGVLVVGNVSERGVLVAGNVSTRGNGVYVQTALQGASHPTRYSLPRFNF